MKDNIIKNLTHKDDKYACAFSDKIISESKETDRLLLREIPETDVNEIFGY